MHRDITYCASNCVKTDCYRYLDKKTVEIRYVWQGDFSKNCNDYIKPREGGENEKV